MTTKNSQYLLIPCEPRLSFMTVTSSSMVRGVRAGALGGLVTSVITGVLGVLASQGASQEVFFISIAREWGFGDSSVASGWALHLLTGLIVGVIFLGVTSRVPLLGLTTWTRAIWIGAGAGILVWIVLLYPLSAVFIPEAMTSDFLAGSFVGHIIFGVITTLIAVTVLRRGPTVKASS